MARRLNGTGSIFYMKKRKRWIWVGSYKNEYGEKKKKWISAVTQKSLAEKMKDFAAQLEQNALKPDMILEVWIKKWLEVIARPMVSDNTYIWYCHIMKYMNFSCDIEDNGHHIIQNAIGKEKLNLITPIKIQTVLANLKFYGSKKGTPLSARTVNSFRRVLGMALKNAMENDFIKNNPVLKTRPFKLPEEETVVLNEKQVQLFLEILKKGDYLNVSYKHRKRDIERKYYKKEYYALIYLAFASGMRISELCSLRWDDINFINRYLEVKWVLKTKNSKRKINLDKNTIKTLEEFRNFQNQFAKDNSLLFKRKNNLVFTTGAGRKIDPDNFRFYYWPKMLEAASLPENFRIHGMRHTHATLLLKNGINIKVVSQRLGHSTVEFTLKTYAHVIEEMEETAAAAWEKVLCKTELEKE